MPKANFRSLAVLIFSLFLTQCAHYPDVVPGDKGINDVVTHQGDAVGARRDAISQAKDYCDEADKRPVVMEEKTAYEGSMKEEDYNNYRMGAKAAQAVGGAAFVLGGENESNAGGVVGMGGAVGEGMLGKPYSTKMKFKCE